VAKPQVTLKGGAGGGHLSQANVFIRIVGSFVIKKEENGR
jgi:hypothetical protein